MDNIKKAIDIGKKLPDMYSSETATYIKNMIPDSDTNARPQYPGEKHAVIRLANGKLGIANFLGPGTKIVLRTKRNDPGRSYTDNIARAHDLRYALSTFEKTKEAQIKHIRQADVVMINELEKAKEEKKDEPFNINVGLQVIKNKNRLEDVGILDKGKFAGKLNEYPKNDKVLLSRALKSQKF
jgi:hypothetical protein